MKKQSETGFTLIELLVVITIIVMLMSLLMVGVFKVLDYSKIATSQQACQTISRAIGIYFQDKASSNSLTDNQIKQSGIYGIYTKVITQASNILGVNELYRNRKDVAGMSQNQEESE